MPTLTKAMRDHITETLRTKAQDLARERNKSEYERLGELVYASMVTSAQEALMEQLPKHFLERVDALTVCADMEARYQSRIQLKLTKERPIPATARYYADIEIPDKKLRATIMTFKSKMDAEETERKELLNDVRGLLASVRTTQKLAEVAPNLAALLPADAGVIKHLPVPMMENLAKRLVAMGVMAAAL